MSATPFRQVVRRWLRAGLAIACFASLGTRPVAAGVDAWTANGPFVTGSAGSARRLTVDPRNPAIIYAGASTSFDCGSSVFRSTNGGASWQTVLDEIPCVDAIAIDPADPRIVHVGVDSGVYTTADGGDTWRTVDLPQVTDTDSVICLAVDPTQPATLYTGTRSACFNHYGCSGRLLKSSDGGTTWATISNYDTAVNAIVVAAEGTVYVAGGTDYSQPLPGDVAPPGFLIRSGDGGASWTDIDPKSGAFVVQLLLPPPAGTLHAATTQGLFASGDNGHSWRSEAANLPIEQLAADPVDAHSLYAVGNHFNAGLYTTEVQHSSDDGQTWATLTNPPVPDGGFAPGGLVVTATQPTTLYVAYSDQLYRSTDAGTNWMTSGIGLGSVVGGGLAFDPLDDTLFVAAQTVFRTTDQAASWSPRGEPLDFLNSIAFDPRKTGTLYVSSFEGVRKSVDDGLMWRAINQGLPYGQGSGGLPGGVLAVDPTVPDILYLAATGLFTSNDGGESWTQAHNGLPDDLDARSVAASASRVYAGTVAGVYASADHGRSWSRQDIESAGLRFVVDVAVDPHSTERVYIAAFEGVGRSSDAGATWTRISAGTLLDGQSCTSIAVNPVDASTLYVGTFAGIYRSRDAGVTWVPFSAGITNNQIVDLVVDPRDGRFVYAATQFTGVYVIEQSDIASPTTTASRSHDESGCTLGAGAAEASSHGHWWALCGALLLALRRCTKRRPWT